MHHRSAVKSKKSSRGPHSRMERRSARRSERMERRGHQNNNVYELPDRESRPSFADRGYLYDEQNTSGEFNRWSEDQGYGSHYPGGQSSGTYESDGYGRKTDYGASMEDTWMPHNTGWRPAEDMKRPDEYDSAAWNENHTGKGPKGYVRSDEKIREQVCDLLMDHPEIDASDMEVEVAGGEVTLKGTVGSRQIKRLTEDVVHSLSAVREVHNQLKLADKQTEAQ